MWKSRGRLPVRRGEIGGCLLVEGAVRANVVVVEAPGFDRLARVDVHDREDAKAPARSELIRDEVDRPALVGADGGQKRLRALPEPLSWALARQAEPFRAVEPQKPFVVEAQSVLTKEIPQASISESGTLQGDLSKLLA